MKALNQLQKTILNFFCFQIRGLKLSFDLTQDDQFFPPINQEQSKKKSRNLNHFQVHLVLDNFRPRSM